jgi:hypothetical protein
MKLTLEDAVLMDCCKFQEPTGVKTKLLNKTRTKFRDEHLAGCGVTTTTVWKARR